MKRIRKSFETVNFLFALLLLVSANILMGVILIPIQHRCSCFSNIQHSLTDLYPHGS